MRVHICFVCLGNICRSPIAEVVLRSMLATRGLDHRIAVCSAGTGDWHIGEPADERTLDVLERHGYDGSRHRAQQITRELFTSNDLVIAMDSANVTALRRLAPDEARDKVRLLREFDPAATDTDVPDPYYGGAQGFEDVLAMVEAACAGLVEQLSAELAG